MLTNPTSRAVVNGTSYRLANHSCNAVVNNFGLWLANVSSRGARNLLRYWLANNSLDAVRNFFANSFASVLGYRALLGFACWNPNFAAYGAIWRLATNFDA